MRRARARDMVQTMETPKGFSDPAQLAVGLDMAVQEVGAATKLCSDTERPRLRSIARLIEARTREHLHSNRRETVYARISGCGLDVAPTKSFPYIVETICVFER